MMMVLILSSTSSFIYYRPPPFFLYQIKICKGVKLLVSTCRSIARFFFWGGGCWRSKPFEPHNPIEPQIFVHFWPILRYQVDHPADMSGCIAPYTPTILFVINALSSNPPPTFWNRIVSKMTKHHSKWVQLNLSLMMYNHNCKIGG